MACLLASLRSYQSRDQQKSGFMNRNGFSDGMKMVIVLQLLCLLRISIHSSYCGASPLHSIIRLFSVLNTIPLLGWHLLSFRRGNAAPPSLCK